MSQRRYSKSRGNGMDERSTPIIGPEVALEYQNLCISHLMSLSGDPTEVQDENLLAAAVILRFYEELDGKCSVTAFLSRATLTRTT